MASFNDSTQEELEIFPAHPAIHWLRTRAAHVDLVIPSACPAARNISVGECTPAILAYRRLGTAPLLSAPFPAGPVLQVPRVPHAPCVGPTRRHPALLIRGEAAVAGTPVVGTPWTIGLGSSRASNKRGESCDHEQGEDGADHGKSPNCAPRPIDRSPSC